jgi:hypothetical protein
MTTEPDATVSAAPWREAMDLLGSHGVDVWLGGGWAAELHQMEAPRAHRDVDLHLPAESFATLDAVLEGLEEVRAKRFPHKRAFVHAGWLVEVVLMQPEGARGHHTRFFDLFDLHWPAGSLTAVNGVRILSVAALQAYDRAYPQVAAARKVWLGG